MEMLREIELADSKGVTYMADKNLNYEMGGNKMTNALAITNEMNRIQRVFNYEGQKVRTVLINGEPWFVGVDVCNILEINNSRQAISYLDVDEKQTIPSRSLTVINSDSQKGGAQYITIINEPGLYSLILRSRKPEAKAFKRWITHEVIPSIRKTGAYEMPGIVKDYLAMSEEDRAIAFFKKSKEFKVLEAENKILKPKAGKYDDFLNSDGVFDWDAISSTLDIGRNTMLLELRERGYLQKRKGNNWNLALRRYEEAGWFVTKAVSQWTDKFGNEYPKYKTFVTPTGLDNLIELFRKWGY
ncbi:prophage antirepressor [Desulfofarcimen acetoxidans DSM 771]|uniref:Prophage antirepressor n=1 Tax=Desulfofarcimen acetoxidans (strain ATCC 49208 / DSM 771 / KCTC 5769 / VKM B-1644 / 5575) TaxID=485916 RepID=C8VXR4_DESAS|nr:phage antirepressor KilAC domain-containing protein [Desulfofarcimen acetoxidans]ACV62720.1 prophage antirepressor [Desulfofarcimen acetoxidans DSM 771]